MKCEECKKDFEEKELQKCFCDKGFLCENCIDEEMDRFYDSESECELDSHNLNKTNGDKNVQL